jgi:ribA/ribD-fused uncharacterized protein
METTDSIYFYGVTKLHGYMSNFYNSDFNDTINGKLIKFNCSEQYFMYYKCLTFDPNNKKLLKNILNETKPMVIKKYGRQVNNFVLDVWNEKRYEIMVNALRLKFKQNQDIKDALKNTGNKEIYEASPYDNIWGTGFDYTCAFTIDKADFGTNLLGKALMKVRSEL